MPNVHRILTSADEADVIILGDVTFSVAELRTLAKDALKVSKAAGTRLGQLKTPDGQDQKMAGEIWNAVAAEGNFSSRSRMVGLLTLWRNFRADRTIKLAGDIDKMKGFIAFIKDLGIPASQIILKHHTAVGCPADVAARLRQQWANNLGFQHSRCSSVTDGRAKPNSVSIKVTYPVKSGHDPQASNGFLYVCLLLFIAGTWQKAARRQGRQRTAEAKHTA